MPGTAQPLESVDGDEVTPQPPLLQGEQAKRPQLLLKPCPQGFSAPSSPSLEQSNSLMSHYSEVPKTAPRA